MILGSSGRVWRDWGDLDGISSVRTHCKLLKDEIFEKVMKEKATASYLAK